VPCLYLILLDLRLPFSWIKRKVFGSKGLNSNVDISSSEPAVDSNGSD
jgi:hypothetical protein